MHDGKRITLSSSRLSTAFGAHSPEGRVLLVGPDGGADLSAFDPVRTVVLSRDAGDHAALKSAGWQVATETAGGFDAAVVFLPRARAEARARLADAAACLAPGAPLWVDGQKTDGIDSVLKELRGLTETGDVLSKAHGKLFSARAGDWVPQDWHAADRQVADGFVTRPGVFSADGVDPGSAVLAAALPDKLPTRVVELGAGWGWLAAQILTRTGVGELHLVETDLNALDCARRNVTDPKVRFHWSDIRDFSLPEPVNGVIMNPPFHQGRAGDPGLGAAFIRKAAQLLTGAGRLWMVANRHLPYEAVLAQEFGEFREIAGDNRFKVIVATGARRKGGRG